MGKKKKRNKKMERRERRQRKVKRKIQKRRMITRNKRRSRKVLRIKRRKSNSHRHYSQADLTKLQLRTSQRKDFTSVTLRQSLSHKQ